MKLIPLEQEDDSKYADHGLTIAPTASSLLLVEEALLDSKGYSSYLIDRIHYFTRTDIMKIGLLVHTSLCLRMSY